MTSQVPATESWFVVLPQLGAGEEWGPYTVVVQQLHGRGASTKTVLIIEVPGQGM